MRARFLMPRHVGGNETEPAEWIPVCHLHARGWWDEVPEADRLPGFPLPIIGQPGAPVRAKR